MDDYVRACYIQSHHVFVAMWTAVIGEVLVCQRESTSDRDWYTVAVIKSGTIIGHVLGKYRKSVCCLCGEGVAYTV